MDLKREKELKQLWETLKMLNMDIEPENIREVLPNTEMYETEISLMIRLRILSNFPNKYKYLNDYIKSNPYKIPSLIEMASQKVKEEKLPLTLEYCGCLLSEQVREMEAKEIDMRPTKIYVNKSEGKDEEGR